VRPALQAETCPGALRLRRVAALSGCDVSLKAPGRFHEMRMCTCAYAQARAQARTHRLTHMQMPHRRSPSPTAPCLSFAARSRRGRPDTSASARPLRPLAPARQRSRRLTRRECWYTKALADAADWRGVAAQERAARAVAAGVRTSMPGVASSVYCTLGIVFHSLEDYFKAIEYDMEHLT